MTQFGRAFNGESHQAGPVTDRDRRRRRSCVACRAGGLGEVADRSGLTAGLSEVLAEAPRRRHDPGVGLAQLVLALSGLPEVLHVTLGQPR
jgi:hypothetical protein